MIGPAAALILVVAAAELNLPDFTTLWDFAHPDSTEAAFRALLPAARESGEADYLAQLLTQIARTQGLQRQFDAAHATLDEAEAMLPQALGKARVRYLLERGRVWNTSGHPETGKPLFLEAWDLARAEKLDGLAIDAAHMVAIVGTPDSSIAWNERAMAHAEASSDPQAKGWLGSLYNNLGWAYHDRGDYAQALPVFEKALAWFAGQKAVDETRIANWTVARCLRSLGRAEAALARQEALAQEFAASGDEDGYVFEEMGECLLLLGRDAEAQPHFARAYALLSRDEWLAANEPARLERLKKLGEAR
ncbi:MAG: tetratricopeptide repeat protein [Candidatus Eisenbacteria bacterium]|nr:tetratricopeptide repeat protein [Candidatus Eisenbacteria bacterium]